MLGRGLNSLIPDKNNNPDNNQIPPSNPIPNQAPPTDVPTPINTPAIPPVTTPNPEPEPDIKPASPPASPPEETLKPNDHIFQLEVDKIKANPYQPRRHFDEDALRELASSISEYGILQPLVVSKNIIETPFGTDVEYELIAGERRLKAAKLAGLERVPAIIKSPPPKKEKLELAIIENLQREDLSPIESARAFAKLQDDYGMTQREIALRMGKSRESIANTMRLLSLPTYIQEAVERGKISESQARLLLSISDFTSQQNLFEELIKNSLSVRELRNRIVSHNARANAVKRFTDTDPELRHLSERLSEILGTKVKVEQNGETGKITISFTSSEELKSIIDRVAPDDELSQ